jgi:hypothetical protein
MQTIVRLVVGALVLLSTAAIAAQPAKTRAAAHHGTSPYVASERSDRARNYYQAMYGVDSLVLKSVKSDQLIRFSYRVINADRAKAWAVKEATPTLYDVQSHVSLVVPTMDKVGQLRQSGPPENGKTYWMVFSNKGNVVKPGHRVGVSIGAFKANGLAVE